MTCSQTPEAVAAELVQKLAARTHESLSDTPHSDKVASAVDRLGELISNAAASGGATVGSWFEQMSPQTRAALRNAVVGGGVGAGVGLLGGGTAYDAARGAAALGIIGGAGTYAANKALDLGSGGKFVPPSVEKSLNEMRNAGQPTVPQGDGSSNPLSWMLNNPATTGVAGLSAGVGGAAVYDAMDTRRPLDATFRSPLYHMGAKDQLRKLRGVTPPPTVLDKLRNVAKATPEGAAARRDIIPAIRDKTKYLLGMTDEGRRAHVLNKTRTRLAAARAAAAAGNASEAVAGIDALLSLDDEGLRKALQAADRHSRFSERAVRSVGTKATRLQDSANIAAQRFRLASGQRLTPQQFTQMVTRRPLTPSWRGLTTALLAGTGAVLADKYAKPALSNAVFGPSITAEDVRRMGNP